MHAVLATAALPLFLGALLSDSAYAATYQVQWTNFADWLNAAGLALAGVALAWALVSLLISRKARARRAGLYLSLLGASVVVGFVNALVHAQDGWAAMPAATVLSAVALVLAAAACAIGLAAVRRGAEA